MTAHDDRQRPTADRLREVGARVEAATPGPWEWDGFDDVTIIRGFVAPMKRYPTRRAFSELVSSTRWVATPDVVVVDGLVAEENDGETVARLDSIAIDQADAEFIAAARSDVPYLLDLVAALEAEVRRGREAVSLLRAQFIKHRTATHEVTPMVCLTCQESDAILAREPGTRGALIVEAAEAAAKALPSLWRLMCLLEIDNRDAQMDAYLDALEPFQAMREKLRALAARGADGEGG